LEIGDDVFYLTRDELFDALRVGFAPLHAIEQRNIARRAQANLLPPYVIDLHGIDQIGDACEQQTGAGGRRGFPISSGQASGPARIVRSASEAGDLGRGYILVCPSTDPSWTPLFVNAAGLVLECGGTLSHGAIVARELGLPAVVMPDAMSLFAEGKTIRIDGSTGWIGPASAADDEPAQAQPAASIGPDLIPPPPGRKDRRAARLRNVMALIWAVYLLAFFTLPQRWVHDPTMRLLDLVLWPIVRWAGKPLAVVIIAAGIAIVTLLVQKFLTDNRRLRVAKHRATQLTRQARSLPGESPVRAEMNRLAAPVHARALLAALVPIGILLGPMMLPFVWFAKRVDPKVWNAPPGSPAQIVAMIDGEWTQPVQIEVPPGFEVDQATPALRTLPPLRATLERLLSLYRQPRSQPDEPWELKLAPDLGRQQMADDLKAYLDAGIPPQGMTWLIRPARDAQGRFPIAVRTVGHAPVTIDVVLGDKYPPSMIRAAGLAGSPIVELRASYPRPKTETHFFRPFGSFEVGWVWTYVIAYLCALLPLRAALKVA
jgi:pyruvate,water dikinase